MPTTTPALPAAIAGLRTLVDEYDRGGSSYELCEHFEAFTRDALAALDSIRAEADEIVAAVDRQRDAEGDGDDVPLDDMLATRAEAVDLLRAITTPTD